MLQMKGAFTCVFISCTSKKLSGRESLVPGVFDEARTGEGDGRVGVDVEVLGGAQILVTLGDVGVDASRCNGDRHSGLREFLGNRDLSGELGEPAAHLVNHDVMRREI